jgi:FkbM family methyltransferase
MADTQTNGCIEVRLQQRTFRVVASRPEIAAFWANAVAGRWEDETFRFLDAVADPEAVLVDVGAWIGPVSLYASPLMARVIALEPDPVAHGELKANIAGNVANVEIWNAAINLEPGELKLYAPQGFGNSETSSIGEGEPLIVKTVTFADIDAAIDAASKAVLKVDIEGHEYRVMDALIAFAKARRAPVHLSLHPRSFWNECKRQKGWFSARRETYRVTMDAIAKLSSIGPVAMSHSGAPITRAMVFQRIFLKKRPKNFSVEVRTPV